MSRRQQTPEPDLPGQVADAPKRNWVDRYCPVWSQPYLRLSRADRPIGTWLLLIPCWWGLALAILVDPQGANKFDLWIATACIFGAFLMRGAGCTWNDITDRDIDGKVARTRSRPIPSGQVSTKQALIWLMLQALLALAILLSFNRFSIWLGVVALVPVAIYPFAKRFTWWPQAFLGIAFNWGALMGWAAHTGSLAWPAILLYLAGISWTLFYDTIYAHQDKEDDALIGVKSTARFFADNTKRWLLGFLLLSTALIGGAAGVASLHGLALLVALSGVFAFAGHMFWQLNALDIDSPENCLRVFRSNRDAGLIIAMSWMLAILV